VRVWCNRDHDGKSSSRKNSKKMISKRLFSVL